GKTASGTLITNITGTGFQTGATVTIGGTLATSVVVVNSTTITCTAPSGTTGAARDIVVLNTDGQSGTLTGAYTYQAAPTLTSVSPPSGLIAGGNIVALTGT